MAASSAAIAVDQQIKTNNNNVSSKTNNLIDVKFAGTKSKIDDEKVCCNPFRIPQHKACTNLRNVPILIREQLRHVSFGKKICTQCRKRVHKVLQQRKIVKRNTRSNFDSHKKKSTTSLGDESASGTNTPIMKNQHSRNSSSTSSSSTNEKTKRETNRNEHQQQQQQPVPIESRVTQRDLPPIPATAQDVVEQLAAITPEQHSSADLVGE